MKKTVQIEIYLYGDGVVKQAASGALVGGMRDPEIDGQLEFNVARTELDENGIWNPALDGATDVPGLQIEVLGTSDGYRELAKYFLAIAELDTSADPDYHDHHDNLVSKDGKTNLHVIVRKHP